MNQTEVNIFGPFYDRMADELARIEAPVPVIAKAKKAENRKVGVGSLVVRNPYKRRRRPTYRGIVGRYF